MHKITNRTAQPHDIHTRSGVKAIHARGTLTAEFDPAYLEIIRLSFDVEEVGGNSDPAEPDRDPREEYKALTGKKPDGRWSDERILSEIEGLEA